MALTKEKAEILWDWKGTEEWSETKAQIKKLKRNIQRLGNRLASNKGNTLKLAEAINILSGELTIQMKYLRDIRGIRELADL